MKNWCWLALLLVLPVTAQENLLANGSFEVDADGDGVPEPWDVERQQNEPGTIVQDTEVAVDGQASLRIEHPNASGVWVRSSVVNLDARPRTTYRLDLAVRSTGHYNIVLYEFFPQNSDPAYLTHTIANGGGTDGQWRRIGATITTIDQARSFKISLIADGQGTVWFDDVRLVKVGAIPEADATFSEQPPMIDGALTDTVWAGAEVYGPFYTLGGIGERPTGATWFRVAWSRTHLYFAITAEESRLDAVRAEVTEYDGPVYTDDSVEVFLDPDNDGTGYAHLAVNARGTRFDDRLLPSSFNTLWYSTGGARNLDWDPAWQAATRAGERDWTAEIALPLESLGGALAAGDVWGLNVTRERYVVEELSTWSPLSGTTFLQPGAFGKLIFRGPPQAIPDLVTRTPGEVPARGPLVPQPQQVEWGSAQLRLPKPLPIQPADGLTIPQAQLDLLGEVRVGAPAHGNGVTAAVVPNLDVPAEGYTLTVKDGGGQNAAIELLGKDAAGVRNGLMTLSQLLFDGGDQYLIVAVSLRDWPDTPLRGWHVGSPGAADGEVYRTWVNTLAKLKYNTIMLEVNDTFPYQSHPEIAAANAPTKAQLKEWVDYAKALGFEVIPQVQVYGHFNWVLNKPGWADLAEDPTPDERRGLWNANIRNPRYYPLVFDLYQEVIDLFAPTIFHIGHDEITFRPIGVHGDTKDTAPHLLFAEEVNRLHEWLTARGLKVMMWGDQLLQEHHGGAPYNTYLATVLIPKDILIADWHYAPTETYPSVEYFQAHGFPVVAVGWWDPLNMIHFTDTAVDRGILGFSGSSWWALANFANSAEHQTAFVLAAENAWSNREPRIEEMDYRPSDRWRELAGWASTPEETKYAPLDLSGRANQPLLDNPRRTGWLGLGPDQDLRNLPTGRQWWGGVPFDIPHDGAQAILLATEGDAPGAYPVSAKAIPVGRAARALHFLHTTSAPARRYGNIYDRGRNFPNEIGRYVVHYADGTSETISIRYRWNITDWNDGLPPARGTFAWSGRTPAGALAQVATWRWENPAPEKVIESIDVISLESPLRIAVLGITAAVE